MNEHPKSDAIKATVSSVIANDLNLDAQTLKAETSLDDLGIDSLRAISILYSIEDLFSIEIPNDEIEGLEKVGDLFSAVARNL